MHFLVSLDTEGIWHWKLRLPDKRTIASSGEDYATRVACEDGIDLVKTTNAGTPVRYTP